MYFVRPPLSARPTLGASCRLVEGSERSSRNIYFYISNLVLSASSDNKLPSENGMKEG